jgi:hypothetical protein
MAYKAKLRPKREWQQDNCIGWWLGCKNESVEEAVHGNAAVRCCQRERCMLFAVVLAVEQGASGESDLYESDLDSDSR